MVGLLVHAEVLARRAAVDPVETREPLPLHPRDLGLAALDRVHPRQPAEIALGRRPVRHALSGLRRRLGADLAAGSLDEAVPEADVGLLLGGMGGDLVPVPLGRGLNGLAAEAGERLRGVAVLAGVACELLARELTGGPPHVEGVLEHVMAGPTLLDALPDRSTHEAFLLARGRGQHTLRAC